ncbi:MAG: glycosyl hydrolase family 17 protein, partial [Armatimonadetes bacterium]|nr:glycosyl hydrolase family 17 protein [Armatimonadota bacterium]
FINVHPYWERQPIENAVAYVLMRYEETKAKYPNKHVILSETGWPSAGAENGAAVPSLENQRRFIKELMSEAIKQNIGFFLFEAFDERWKREVEGEVGAHWGFYNSQREQKHDFGSLLPASP